MTHNALVPGTNVLVIVGAVHQETEGHTDRGKKHSKDSQYPCGWQKHPWICSGSTTTHTHTHRLKKKALY